MEPAVVEALDEAEHIPPGLGAVVVDAMMDALGLEGVEEALHRGIVPAVALAAHRGRDAGAREGVAIGLAAYWMPRSEWWIRSGLGRWRSMAMLSASMAISACRVSRIAQPTILRVCMSRMAAR